MDTGPMHCRYVIYHYYYYSYVCVYTVFPRIDRVRSINFSLSKLRAIIEGAFYFESALAEQTDAILACVNLWSQLCTRVNNYILRGVFEGALYFTTH